MTAVGAYADTARSRVESVQPVEVPPHGLVCNRFSDRLRHAVHLLNIVEWQGRAPRTCLSEPDLTLFAAHGCGPQFIP
jgi:hypothetical protein